MSERLAAATHRLLREATRGEHAAAEATAIMQRLLHGQLDRSGYVRLLHAHWSLYDAWERLRAGWLHGELVTAGWRYRPRSPALRQDLAALGMALPDTASRSSAHDSDEAGSPWGELYVVEGSLLGGRIIARRLQQQFPDHPHRFFRFGEEAPDASWRHFQLMLDRLLDSDARRDGAVAGARFMFARFQNMLEGLRA